MAEHTPGRLHGPSTEPDSCQVAPHAAPGPRRRLPTTVLVFLLPALVGYGLGLLALGQHLVDWNSLAAAGHAYDVFNREPEANMALIGFVQPPLPALLYLPAALVAPGWLASGHAAPLLGAIFLGLCALLLDNLCRCLSLPTVVRLPLLVIFCLHPLMLSYAALGSPAIILVFTYLGLSRALICWGRDQNLRDLIAAGLYGAAAILVSYEAALPVLAAAIFFLSCCRKNRSGVRSRAEGTLITYLLPAAYVAAIWICANWAIMGSPWYFWRMTVADAHGISLLPAGRWVEPVFLVLFTVQPLLLALLYREIVRFGPRTLAAPAAWLALAALVSPAVFSTLRTSASGAALWAPMMPVVAACLGVGFALLAAVVADYASGGAARKQLRPGFVIILGASLVLAYLLQTSGHGMPTGYRSILRGYAAFGHSDVAELNASTLFKQTFQAGGRRRSYIAGWPGFAIALYSRAGDRITVLPSSSPPPVELGLEAGSSLVLLTNARNHLQQWQKRLPPYLQLSKQWQAGKWVGYEVVLVGATAQQPQPQKGP